MKNTINILQFILFNFLQTLPLFITHKLIKVIVDIGRVDWPMFYPEFFTSLLQLASSSAGEQFGDTRAIGLASLRIASEELISPREDISVQRKEELKKLLLSQVPDIIKVITSKLNHWLVNQFLTIECHFVFHTKRKLTTTLPNCIYINFFKNKT